MGGRHARARRASNKTQITAELEIEKCILLLARPFIDGGL